MTRKIRWFSEVDVANAATSVRRRLQPLESQTSAPRSRPFILAATDFSPRAIDAATTAARLARRRAEPLRLVHIAESVSATAVTMIRRRLDAEVDRLRDTGTDVAAVFLESRHPADALLEAIRSDPPTLTVVAAGVKGALDRWAIGSFSERIAEASPAPTLVLRDPAALEMWNAASGRLTVLLALDFLSSSDVVLRWAKEFHLATPCDFVACHVNRRTPTLEELAVAPGRPVNPPELQELLERDLRRKVRDQLGDDLASVVVRPYFGDPSPCITEIADAVKAHLIVVGTHQRRGLSRLAQFSVSRDLLHNSAKNVLCVPVTAQFDPRDAHIPDFRRVLVATDFSELGNAAIPFACSACSIGGLVKIIHVVQRRPRASAYGANGRPADLRERLQLLIPNETSARGQPPEVAVIESPDIADAICAEAERFGADLVCLSSHGLGASRALHGSVTKAVLKKIRRPLLVIRRPEE